MWSMCQLNCVGRDDLGFGSVQVRSRAVLAQEPENLLQCPEQEWEARPCTGAVTEKHTCYYYYRFDANAVQTFNFEVTHEWANTSVLHYAT